MPKIKIYKYTSFLKNNDEFSLLRAKGGQATAGGKIMPAKLFFKSPSDSFKNVK